MLGLTWDCVDISEESILAGIASIFVNKELQRVSKSVMNALYAKDILVTFAEQGSRNKTVLVLKKPKTLSSTRKVFLPKSVAEMLVAWKMEQDSLIDALGSEYMAVSYTHLDVYKRQILECEAMGRRKFEPGKNGESKVVNLVSPTNGVCANKLFYANRLKEFRAIAHVTQADLASRLGLSVSAIANWESGRTRPDVSNIPALCNVLGISIAEFFSNSLNAEEDERKLLFRYRQLNKPHQMVLLNMAEQLLNAEEQAISSECPELEELLLADDQVAAGANYYDFSAVSYTHLRDTPTRAHRSRQRELENEYILFYFLLC